MEWTTVRLKDTTRNILKELALHAGISMQAALEKAIENYRRQCFLDKVNTAYADLKKDKKAWDSELEERREWDNTLPDGLDNK